MSMRLVTSRADERKPPITQSSSSTTTPLASKRGTGHGFTSVQLNGLPPAPPVPAPPTLPPAPPTPTFDAGSDPEQPVTNVSKISDTTLTIGQEVAGSVSKK